MTPKEARKVLSNFTVEYSGTGNTVISMAPDACSSIAIGSTVRLMLDD